MRSVSACTVLVSLLAAGGVQAQARGRAGPVPIPLGASAPRDSSGVAGSALTVAASALIPGTGQVLTGRDRGALYLVVEAFFVTRFLTLESEGARERERFRELAFTVARGGFTPATRDTSFEYYEQMEKYIESGPYDTDPGPNLVPPSDESSYNGSIWALARQTYLANPDSLPNPQSPEYQRALAFYRARAIGPNFTWSWRNAGLEQDLFRQAIRRSDEAFRSATQQLGLLLANHLLSALDAFIVYRLTGNSRRVSLQTAAWSAWGRPGGQVMARVSF